MQIYMHATHRPKLISTTRLTAIFIPSCGYWELWNGTEPLRTANGQRMLFDRKIDCTRHAREHFNRGVYFQS